MLHSTLGRVRQFRSDHDGVAATEFAMILPFMLVLFIGAVETTGLLNQDRKLSRIANSVTDLVAQAQSVSSAEVSSMFDIGDQILAPYTTTTLNIIVASVSFDEDGDASIDWSECKLTCDEWVAGAEPPITLPDTVASPETSIVVGEASMTYTPEFSGIFTEYFQRATAYNLSDTFYLQPRLTDTVTCDDC
ncbi:TadE/TadG family type IV pilus assembly protein [Roseibium sp.]|uniref:TadE/TadG family type IV pilus assembly protein n=1 Tax=Roseibium sp. TaxID=1936156 RepID=UPI00345BEDC3